MKFTMFLNYTTITQQSDPIYIMLPYKEWVILIKLGFCDSYIANLLRCPFERAVSIY